MVAWGCKVDLTQQLNKNTLAWLCLNKKGFTAHTKHSSVRNGLFYLQFPNGKLEAQRSGPNFAQRNPASWWWSQDANTGNLTFRPCSQNPCYTLCTATNLLRGWTKSM